MPDCLVSSDETSKYAVNSKTPLTTYRLEGYKSPGLLLKNFVWSIVSSISNINNF